MLIAHISDTHIRNLKYHYEYRQASKIFTISCETSVRTLLFIQVTSHTPRPNYHQNTLS
jgi:hypothetical protein